ncbi:MAG: hypothetical protein ACRCYP_03605 [Alphaproteobacteria bacterium]
MFQTNFKVGDKVLFSGGFGQNPTISAIAKILDVRKTGEPIIQILEDVPNIKPGATFQVLWEELQGIEEEHETKMQ